MQMHSFAPELLVLVYCYKNIKITLRPAKAAEIALAGKSQPRASIYTGRYFYADISLYPNLALCPACSARVSDDLARTMALAAWLRDAEEPLLESYMSCAPAIFACYRRFAGL